MKYVYSCVSCKLHMDSVMTQFQISTNLNALIRRTTAETIPWFHRSVITLNGILLRYLADSERCFFCPPHDARYGNCRQNSGNQLGGPCAYPTCFVHREDRWLLQRNKCHCTHLQLKEIYQIICIFDIRVHDNWQVRQRNESKHKTIVLKIL